MKNKKLISFFFVVFNLLLIIVGIITILSADIQKKTYEAPYPRGSTKFENERQNQRIEQTMLAGVARKPQKETAV